MKAIILKASGDTDNLLIDEVALPVPGPNEVLVKVHAISINPVDIKTRKGLALFEQLKDEKPIILGWDISGQVESVGEKISDFRPGDEVFGMVNFPGSGKAYAEYVAAPEAHLALKPKTITHNEAAAGTLAALTAWQVLVHQANISEGQRVLIHAAAGGVGHFGVQIAKHFGAEVMGTASDYNKGFLDELGVDVFIDYKKDKFESQIDQVDVVFDPIGGETTERSIKIIKRGGKLISIVGGVKESMNPVLQQHGISGENYLVHSSGSDMKQLAELLDQGIIKPHISQVFKFDQIAEAHRQIETGKTRGKLIIALV